jgi:hypothetical protein
MDTNIQNVSQNADKRTVLRQLSNSVTDLVKSGEYETINDAVINTFYKDNVHHIFKSFPKWHEEGYTVKKGSKAFVVWGRPKRAQEQEKAEQQGKEATPTDEDSRDFYPLAYLFSNAQVERKKKND